MHYHSAFTLLVSIVMLLNCLHSYLAVRHYRRSNANGNVFNLLLGLYKLNPLKGSQVYKAFSNQMLMGRGEKVRAVLNVESDEIAKEQVKTNLNEIERMIHATSKKPPRHFEKPEYDIDDVSTENFKVDIVVNDKVLSKEEFKRTLHEDIDDFSSILGHIGSNEIDNDIPVTKLLPVNDTIYRNSQMSNLNEPVFEIIDSKGASGNHIGTLVEVRDKTQDEAILDEKIDGMADVIVL